MLNKPEQGYVDYLYVKTPGGTVVNTYTGDLSDVWSGWVAGNELEVLLVPDANYVGPGFWGFYISGFETNTISDGPLAGVTVTAEPGGHTAVTGSDGSFSFSSLEPVTYTLTPARPEWMFNPDIKSVAVPAGGTTNGANFVGYPPGSISGTVTSGSVVQESILEQSPHPYPNNATLDYPVSAPPGTPSMRVHFSVLQVESGFDYVYILDGNGVIVDEITGDLPDMWSSWITGDHLTIQLSSDESYNDYGFVCDKVEYSGGLHPATGIHVGIGGSAAFVTTGTDGTYTIPAVREGSWTVAAAKSYWTFEPLSRSVNVVRGLNLPGIDFAGQIGVMPSSAYIKTLGDHEEVSLAGKVVTAGTDQFTGHFYIEESDQSSGIRVVSSENVTAGKIVTFRGFLGTADNGERQVTPASLSIAPDMGTVPNTLGMLGRVLGGSGAVDALTGAGQRGVYGGIGLNNVGLLVRIVGNVTHSAADCFYVDDGSGAQDDSAYKGVRIDCENVLPPDEGRFVAVTGISSLAPSGGRFYPTVRPRSIFDLDVVH
jgi:hypothetical protein